MDFLKLNELLEQNSFANYIGMELVEIGEGYAIGRIPLATQHTNIYQGMHGGCSYALADTVAGIAAATCGRYVTTINGTMNYLLPVVDTKYVRCRADVVRQGNRIAVLDVKILNDQEEILCNGSFTYYCTNKEIK